MIYINFDVSFCTESLGLSFSKLSFKVAYVYIPTQSSDMFTKSSDMLNKNTLGVKKCKANKKQPYLCATKSFDINWGQEVTSHWKMFETTWMKYNNFIACFQKYDWLCHLAAFFVPTSLYRWPSDKANHTCENML